MQLQFLRGIDNGKASTNILVFGIPIVRTRWHLPLRGSLHDQSALLICLLINDQPSPKFPRPAEFVTQGREVIDSFQIDQFELF